ncbi:hypothetical protein DM02DRAFT_650739 [Periconia macrospinosa]|uniref:Uncharacterized protein n=1 Tax=Periconia macrospinosa TaxID=97972 RepID=A0A2V1E4A2_9PLEO|nr:hypothetical protein DM02DRAFT_650739 [Periconia macrospinosa]
MSSGIRMFATNFGPNVLPTHMISNTLASSTILEGANALTNVSTLQFGNTPATSDKCKPKHSFLHANMYLIGDKYCIDHLKRLAAHNFGLVANRFWNYEYLLGVAKFILANVSRQDKIVRPILVETIGKHIELTENLEMRALMKGHGIAVDVFSFQIAQKREEPMRKRKRELGGNV